MSRIYIISIQFLYDNFTYNNNNMIKREKIKKKYDTFSIIIYQNDDAIGDLNNTMEMN